jgi:hypothetical protein
LIREPEAGQRDHAKVSTAVDEKGIHQAFGKTAIRLVRRFVIRPCHQKVFAGF